MGVWLLQDSPIFWFTGQVVPPTPTVHLGGYTSYDLGLVFGDISCPVLPEVEAAIRAGDRRHTENR